MRFGIQEIHNTHRVQYGISVICLNVGIYKQMYILYAIYIICADIYVNVCQCCIYGICVCMLCYVSLLCCMLCIYRCGCIYVAISCTYIPCHSACLYIWICHSFVHIFFCLNLLQWPLQPHSSFLQLNSTQKLNSSL